MNNEYYKGKVNGTANGIAIGILMAMFLIIGVKCNAQSGETGPLPIAPPTYDTITCHLLYRTKAGQVGIVKGWEVREIESIMDNFVNVKPVSYKEIFAPKHVTFLLANRRRFPKGTEVWKLDQPIKQ